MPAPSAPVRLLPLSALLLSGIALIANPATPDAPPPTATDTPQTSTPAVPVLTAAEQAARIQQANFLLNLARQSIGFNEFASRRIALSADGSMLAVWPHRRDDVTLYQIPVADGHITPLASATIAMCSINDLVLSPDGRRLHALLDKEIRAYDVTTGAQVASFPITTNQSSSALACTHDGTRLIHSDSGCLEVIDARSGAVLVPRQKAVSMVLSLVVSPDDTQLLVASDGRSVQLRDLRDLSLLGATDLPGGARKPGMTSHVTVSPDFTRAAFCDENANISVLELPSLRPVGPVLSPKMASNNKHYAGKSLFLVDWKTNQTLINDPDNRGSTGRLLRIDLATGKVLHERDWNEAEGGLLNADATRAFVFRNKYNSYNLELLPFPFGGRAEKVFALVDPAWFDTPALARKVGDLCLNLGEYEDAITALQHTVLPERELCRELGQLCMKFDLARAAEYYAKGGHTDLLREMAMNMAANKDFKEGVDFARRYQLDEKPLHRMKADSLRKAGKHEEAIAEYVLAEDTSSQQAVADEIVLGKPELALATYARLKLSEVPLCSRLGRQALENANFSEARKFFTRAGDRKGLADTALKLLNFVRDEEAIQLLRELNDLEATAQVALKAADSEKFATAVTLCTMAADPGLTRQVARKLIDKGDIGDAAKLLIDLNDKDALGSLAQLCREKQYYDTAADILAHLGDKDALGSLARLCRDKQYYNTAVDILAHLGDTAAIVEIAQKEEADKDYKAALRHYDVAQVRPASYAKVRLRVKAREFGEKLRIDESFVKRFNSGKISRVFRRFPGGQKAYPEDIELSFLYNEAMEKLGEEDPALAEEVAEEWQALIRQLTFEPKSMDIERAHKELYLFVLYTFALDLLEAGRGRVFPTRDVLGSPGRLHMTFTLRDLEGVQAPAQAGAPAQAPAATPPPAPAPALANGVSK